MTTDMGKIVSLAKRRGFVFPSSEIYGGVAAFWDYGPLGALMKENIKREFFQTFVCKREDVVALDTSIIMSPRVWEASGHVENFTDPLIDCKECRARFRADHMQEGEYVGQGRAKKKNQCPECGGVEFTEARNFQMMFRTFLGPVESEDSVAYLRPETAQGMFVNFKNVLDTQRLELPFGIAQVGKAFRNEITTGNFIFRSREFEQMEIEYFVRPGDDENAFEEWVSLWEEFLLGLGLSKKNLRRREHGADELSHYSKRTVDLEYRFPFGFKELAGVANRGDFDLKAHERASGQNLSVAGEHPYVIEPTVGVDRLLLALLVEGYEEVKGGRTKTTAAAKEVETVLRLDKKVAPVQAAVFPLVKNDEKLVRKAREVFSLLQPEVSCAYDEAGTVGRRYRRADEIGVVWAVTVDRETLEDDTVTVRDRDTMEQERVKIAELLSWLKRQP